MITVEDLQGLQDARLFSSISLESVDHLLQKCQMRNLARGECLLEIGTDNTHLYLILHGELRVYLTDHRQPEHAVFARGDCVGEMSLLDGEKTSALVLASEDTRLLVMHHDILWSLVDTSHGVARNLLAILSSRLRNDNRALVDSHMRSREFEHAASVDALTGVHNRRWMMDAYPRAIARCDHDGTPICGLMTDIDHFKQFNDNFGHLVGDAVLRRVARQLSDGLRPQDMIARFGGEEFLILLPYARLSDGVLIAERLRNLVAAHCGIESDDGLQTVTVSCGVAQLMAGETLNELIARSDLALRRAKDSGRNRIETA